MSRFDRTLEAFRGSEDGIDKPTSQTQGAVTQLTSNSTAVTINAKHGRITMFGPIAASTTAAFAVNCDQVLADGVVLMMVEGVTDTAGLPLKVGASVVLKGQFEVVVRNDDGANASDGAPVIHYLALPFRF